MSELDVRSAEQALPADAGGQRTREPGRPTLAGLPLPGGRQVLLIVAVAVALSLLAFGMLWMDRSTYRVVYHGLSDRDAAAVVESLRGATIPVRIDEASGLVRVPGDRLHEARFKLAAEGLPRGGGLGFDFLQEQSQLGSSQFIETARYRHALETELARSIASLGSVENARVHLAMPPKSAFVREQDPPSASVIVQLYPGRALDQGQVNAIAHLVATSVPGMAPGRVSVIDQLGTLLSREPGDQGMAMSLDQLEYTRRVEERYVRRIEEILSPIVGAGRVRAQAAVDIDFTVVERTEELFDHNTRAIRSEQVYAEAKPAEPPDAEGVPGALTNQVPEAPIDGQDGAQIAQANGEQPADADGDGIPDNLQPMRWTRNYELDKAVSRTRVPTGRVSRLSVAVVLDDRVEVTAEGVTQRVPFEAAELERLTELVRDAVGFNPDRGDSVRVINSTFQGALLPPQPQWWEQPWLLGLGKLLLAAIVVIAVLAMVVRPLMRALVTHLAARPRPAARSGQHLPGGEGAAGDGEAAVLGPYAEGDEEPVGLPQIDARQDYQAHVRIAQSVAASDPRRAAHVLKQWLDDGE